MRKTLNQELGNTLYAARYTFLAVALFSCFLNLLMLVAPFYMLQIYDRVLTSQSKDTLYFLTLLAIGLLAISGVLELIRSRILVRLGARLDRHMTHDLFAVLIQEKISTQSNTGSQPIRDLETVRSFLTGPGLTSFFDAPWTPIFLGIIFLFHPWLGVIALVGALVLLLLALMSEAATRKPMQEASAHSQQAYRLAESSIRNADVVWAMGMLGDLRGRWQEKHFGALGYTGKATDHIGTFMAFAKFIRPILQISILGVGAYLVIEEQITAGVMIAASIIMGRALAPVEASIGHWRSFVMARSAYRRLLELLRQHEATNDKMQLPEPRGALSVENATMVPPGAAKASLLNINFELEAGEMLGVIGPSAAGKSSLARMLMGIWPPKLGHIRLDGAEIVDWDRADLGRYVGYLPQDVELFDGTVAENIARFQEVSSKKVHKAAEMANAHEMILHLQDGYETRIGDGGSALSGGQRQRVGLARALYGLPRLIVLDEPNAYLDSDGEAALRETLRVLKTYKCTVIIISHKRSTLADVDKLLVLDKGRVVTFGPRADVMKKLFTPRVVTQAANPAVQREVAKNDG